jgi:hypothetical protein
LNGVVSGELWNSAECLLINGLGNIAVLALVHIEEPLLNAACGVAIRIAMALVYSVLQDTFVPSVDEISMVTISGRVAMGEDKRLR